ncbi:RNA polymerase sigma factor [Bacteroidota bacterium]
MNNNISKYDDSQLFAKLGGKKDEAEAAFAELYARYSQRIYAYCLRVSGNSDDARDIFQETFIKFFDSIGAHSEIENIPGYLLTIARNICINFKRDQKTNFALEDFHTWTNDDDYEKKELLQLLATALELLEKEYKEAFVLRLYQGLTYKEISKITGDSISAIKNRVWRAKERIKEILTPYLEDLSN